MNENEIVLNLLDFYKRKGLDLYMVLDDPTFKALSLDTKLKAIQNYAKMIYTQSPHGISKRDFKSALKDLIFQTGTGALGGAAAGGVAAAAFTGGRVPRMAVMGGALLGATGSLFNSGFNILNKVNDRHFMHAELKNVVDNPTPGNALNYLTANHLRGPLTEDAHNLVKRISESGDKKLKALNEDFAKRETELYNVSQGHARV